MCKSKILLDSIKKRKNHGMSKAELELAEAQAEDMEKFDKDISGLKKLVTEHIAKTDAVLERIDPLIEQAHQMALVKKILGSWKFWVMALLILIAVALAGERFAPYLGHAGTINTTQAVVN